MTHKVTDVSGNPLEVGTLVAFNYSGQVRIGRIVEVIHDTARIERDKKYEINARIANRKMMIEMGLPPIPDHIPFLRPTDPMDYYVFKVQGIQPTPDSKKLTRVANRKNLHSIETILNENRKEQ